MLALRDVWVVSFMLLWGQSSVCSRPLANAVMFAELVKGLGTTIQHVQSGVAAHRRWCVGTSCGLLAGASHQCGGLCHRRHRLVGGAVGALILLLSFFGGRFSGLVHRSWS